MIIPNVGHHYQYQNVVSASTGSAGVTAGCDTDGASASAGGGASSSSSAPGSADAFGELSSLMQQFLLQIQGGQASGTGSGTGSGTAGGTGGGTGGGTSAGTASTGVEGPTEGSQRAAALQAYAANQGGLAANADRTLGGVYGPARNYAANHDLGIDSRFPGAASAAAANAQTLSGVTLGEAASALA